jgi:hypothetical protein
MNRNALAVVLAAITFIHLADAGEPVMRVNPGDDLQRAIDAGLGTLRFGPGVYYLTRPLRLRSGRTYIGEGSANTHYGSVLVQTMPGAPVILVGCNPGETTCKNQVLDSVTITGLTFDSMPGAGAKGIATAPNAVGLLANSTLRDNHFTTQLTEGIDVPMVATRIERNRFGWNGAPNPPANRRHIRSVYSTLIPGTNANWLVGNQFSSAKGSESVWFERGVQLHVIGNQFEGNEASTTLRVNGMFQVIIEGNYFERNSGLAQMTFGNTATSDGPMGNYIVRLENNFYNLQGAGNTFIANASGATRLYMGFESGTQFPPDAQIVPPQLFDLCYLKVTGPFRLNGYNGPQTGGNTKCP